MLHVLVLMKLCLSVLKIDAAHIYEAPVLLKIIVLRQFQHKVLCSMCFKPVVNIASKKNMIQDCL